MTRNQQARKLREERRAFHDTAKDLQRRVPELSFTEACDWVRTADRRLRGIPE